MYTLPVVEAAVIAEAAWDTVVLLSWDPGPPCVEGVPQVSPSVSVQEVQEVAVVPSIPVMVP